MLPALLFLFICIGVALLYNIFLCSLTSFKIYIWPLNKLASVFKYFVFLFFFVTLWLKSNAQLNTENQFAKPLKEVLQDVQKKYGITIKFADSMVKNKTVTYADWKYRPDVDVTLDNILKPLDLKVKKEGDKKYKLSYYEYYRWQPAEGWAELDRIAAQYKNVEEWEKRKEQLNIELLEKMQLQHLPIQNNKTPIVTPIQKYDGYTMQNMAIELWPGMWINGTLYAPIKTKSKIPVILHPQGHWDKHRYRADCQYTSAALAKMGAMVFNYDMFAYGESQLQVSFEDHRKSRAMSLQVLGSIRILDYVLSLKNADTNRVAIVGGSGGGTLAIVHAAVDSRIKVVAPVVSLSSYFYGGCPCESGMDIHSSCGRTNNVEIAAMIAPKPMLVVSDGGDWTDKMPEHDFLYLQKIWNYYSKQNFVQNVHLPNDKHDFGFTKRKPVYEFIAKFFNLSVKNIQNTAGDIVDTAIQVLPEKSFFVFGDKGEQLPANALKGFDTIEKSFVQQITKAKQQQRYKIGLIDLMLLKRQKLGAVTLTAQLKADGLEVDMGGLGNRPTFENVLKNDTIRNQYIKTAADNNVEIFCLAMTGYYAQSFCNREQYILSIKDCINTMQQMNVKIAFLPLGVQCDLTKNPEVRDSVVARLKVVAKLAEAANVVIAIETALSATEEVKLLKQINSQAIKICFNFSNPLKENRDIINEIKILGKERIALIHATNKDSVWLQNDPQINMTLVKQTLDEIGWSGWLLVERSRDAKKSGDTKYNYGANVAYLKKIFQLAGK